MYRQTILARVPTPNIWRLIYEEVWWTPEDVEAETLANYWYPWPGNTPEYQPIYTRLSIDVWRRQQAEEYRRGKLRASGQR